MTPILPTGIDETKSVVLQSFDTEDCHDNVGIGFRWCGLIILLLWFVPLVDVLSLFRGNSVVPVVNPLGVNDH